MNKVNTAATTFSIAFFAALLPNTLPAAAAPAQDPSSPEFYTTRVAPILQENCGRCHGGMNHRGGLSIDTKESLLKGGKSGAVIVPGYPEQSLLIKLIHQADLSEDARPMPPKGKLTDEQIQIIEQWIKAGAVIPSK
jgi:cytochrome c